jgi:hypothetical protein
MEDSPGRREEVWQPKMESHYLHLVTGPSRPPTWGKEGAVRPVSRLGPTLIPSDNDFRTLP